ncbi:MAG: AtpZ/AtpI family protein [Hyphomicrobiaceae bacterium]
MSVTMPVDGKDNQGRRGELTPEEREAFKRRSDELGRRLSEAREHRTEGSAPRATGTGRGEAMTRAMRVSAELIGGIVVGGAIGWFIDGWLGLEKPWFFILFFLLGAAAGILNVIRMASRERTPPLPSVPDEREDDN